MSKKNGVDYLKYVEPVIKIKGYSFVYKPKYRGVEYLSNNIKELVNSSSDVNKSSWRLSNTHQRKLLYNNCQLLKST